MLQGTFGNFKLTDVLHLLVDSGKSGVLRVWGDGESRAYFRDGLLSTVVANGRVVPLAQCLRSHGLLTEEQLADVLAQVGSADHLGSHLLETRLVDPEILRPVLRRVFDDAVFGLLRRAHSEFRFETLDDVPEGMAVPVEEALEEGWRRVHVWETLRERIPCAEAIPALAPEPPTDGEEVKVPCDEWHRLSLIDGHRSVEQLAQHGCEGELETFLAVDRLVRTGLVTIQEPPATRSDDQLPKPVSFDPEELRFANVEPVVDRADIVRELAVLGDPGPERTRHRPEASQRPNGAQDRDARPRMPTPGGPARP
jgi:hypothetical protein